MPMPKAKPGESKEDFMGRCHSVMNDEFPDKDQRHAVCMRQGDKAEAVWEVQRETSEMIVIPDGETALRDGRKWTLDADGAAAIVKKFNDDGIDLVVDYEHQTLGGEDASPSGQAPAAGWVKALRYEPGTGLIATVEWTDRARSMIRDKEYRYMSPVVRVKKETGKAFELLHVALTNNPAIPRLEPIAAKLVVEGSYLIAAKAVKASVETTRGVQTMDLKVLRDALAAAGIKLAEGANDTDVLTAACKYIGELKPLQAQSEAAQAIANSVRVKLGVANDANAETIAAKLDELRKETVPASEYKAVTARLETLEIAAKAKESQELVATAIETAKLNPNNEKQMTWARESAKCDPIAFKGWMESAPELYTPGRITKDAPKLDKSGDRASVIVAAKAEYQTAKFAHRPGGERYFIDAGLREKNMATLTEAEVKALG